MVVGSLFALLSRKTAISLKRGKIGPRLLSMINRKSICAFDWCQNQRPWMTLKGHYTLCFKTHASFGAHQENLNEARPILSATRMTLDFSLDGASNDSGIIENIDFQAFRTLRLRHLRKWGQHYYIVLFSPLSTFHWSQNTWPWMTLSGLNGHFTLNFHYYELTLRVIIYLFAVESVYILTWPSDMCGSGVADCDPQNIWDPRKDCGSFVDEKFRALHRRNLNKYGDHYYI